MSYRAQATKGGFETSNGSVNETSDTDAAAAEALQQELAEAGAMDSGGLVT